MSKPTTPRQSKTPRQRAQEALDVEVRRVKRLTEKRDAFRKDLDAVQAELETAGRREKYLAAHPDLGDPAQMSIPFDGVGSISINTEPSS